MTLDLASIDGVALDMDGVLWRSSQVLPGIPNFFDFLQQHGIAFAFATNNSMTSVAAYVERLRAVGIPARPEQVVTSAVATADYISRRYPASQEEEAKNVFRHLPTSPRRLDHRIEFYRPIP